MTSIVVDVVWLPHAAGFKLYVSHDSACSVLSVLGSCVLGSLDR